MNRPGARALSGAVRTALDLVQPDELRLINAMTPREAAEVLIASFDAEFMLSAGHRATPEFLRSFADEAEKQAAEFRRIAAQREREAS
jgi:hypothetical protein